MFLSVSVPLRICSSTLEDLMAKSASTGSKSASAGKGTGKEEKKKNPLLKKARTKYAKKLKAEGVSQTDLPTKIKAYMKDTVRPALTEAREAANSKSLKGQDRQKFIEEQISTKLNWRG